jgi:hypothetical protein
MRWAGHVARVGETTGEYMALVEIPEGRKRLGRATHRCDDNIKIYLKEIGLEGAN